MKDATVTVALRVRRPDGKRPYYTAVLNTNGRLKPFFALVDGQPTHLPGAVYYLRYQHAGKRVWERVGNDAGAALTAKLRREHLLTGTRLGLEASPTGNVGLTPQRSPHALGRSVACFYPPFTRIAVPSASSGVGEQLPGMTIT